MAAHIVVLPGVLPVATKARTTASFIVGCCTLMLSGSLCLRLCDPSSSTRNCCSIAVCVPTCSDRLFQQCIGQLWKPPPTPPPPMPAPPPPCGDDHCHTFGNDGLNGSDFSPIGTSGGSGFFVGRSFSLSCLISDEEPGVWGLDAKMPMKVGSVSVTVKQHTEGRLADIKTGILHFSCRGGRSSRRRAAPRGPTCRLTRGRC